MMNNDEQNLLQRCYLEEPIQVCTGLWMFGLRVIKDSYIFKNYDAYALAVRSKDTTLLDPFQWNSLIDNVRIIVYFENYCKAILLMKGYLVHLPNDNANKRNRLESPTLFSEYSKRIGGEIKALKSLSQKTITVSAMLREEYQRVINLSPELHKAVKRINLERNNLHLLETLETLHGREVGEQLDLIRAHYLRVEMSAIKNNIDNPERTFINVEGPLD